LVRPQREIDNLWPDPGAIAERDADTWFSASVHARDRNRLHLIDHEHTQRAKTANMGLIFPAV
jgi:hypothetical protein